MIDINKYESMRQLFLDFIDTASDEVDEEAWKNKLTMIDELLAEVKELQADKDEGLTADEWKDVVNGHHNLLAEVKRLRKRIDYLESIAEEYRQERPEELCANCYAYISEYDGDGVKECLCSDCEEVFE